MEKEKAIGRFSETELEERRARGESRTDLARVQAKTAEELERDIASDSDFSGVPEDWHKRAEAVMPTPKKLLSLRLDSDVVDWSRSKVRVTDKDQRGIARLCSADSETASLRRFGLSSRALARQGSEAGASIRDAPVSASPALKIFATSRHRRVTRPERRY